METNINADDVKLILNNKQLTILEVINVLKRYFLQPEVKNKLLNTLRLKHLENKDKNLNVIKWFIEEYQPLVYKTALCPTEYAAQTLLKTLWPTLGLGNELLYNIRNNIILEEPKPVKLTKEERLARQAEIMREAKARKKREKELAALNNKE